MSRVTLRTEALSDVVMSGAVRSFRWHGCEIQSRLPLAFAPSPGRGGALCELRISSYGELEPPQSAMLAQSTYTGYRLYRDQAGCWLVRHDNQIYLSRDEIRIAPEPSGSDQLEYLRTRALALWLHLVELPPIHAAAVANHGNAAAFVGDSGAGKSTLAAAMSRSGYRLLADDMLPLAAHQGEVLIHPGGVQLRLWPDSAQQFHAQPQGLPCVSPETTKRVLTLEPPLGLGVPRLRSIFLLYRGAAERPVHIEKLPGSKALIALLANGQMAGPAELLGLGATRMRIFAEVLGSVSVYALHYPSDFGRLPEVCAAIDAVVQGSN